MLLILKPDQSKPVEPLIFIYYSIVNLWGHLRREWDLNPRGDKAPTGFRGQRNHPDYATPPSAECNTFHSIYRTIPEHKRQMSGYARMYR